MTGRPGPSRHAVLGIEYDGAPFNGWSRQPDHPSIEGELLAATDEMGLEDVELRCAGRTDGGVHASGQIASLHYSGSVPPERLAPALNGVLHSAICVWGSESCAPEFDARADALSRAYRYRVLTRSARSPMRAATALHHPRPLELAALATAAQAALGQHDFTAFTPAQTDHVFFHRTLLESRWVVAGDELIYEVRANAFLRHMVRILVGSMLAVGRGERTLDWFFGLLEGAPRASAHQTAQPHGLCLVDVEYEQPIAWRGRRSNQPANG